jgi:hypothetical protein
MRARHRALVGFIVLACVGLVFERRLQRPMRTPSPVSVRIEGQRGTPGRSQLSGVHAAPLVATEPARPLPDVVKARPVIGFDAAQASLAGSVVDASGGPVIDARVTLRGSADVIIAMTSSARDGRFEIATSRDAVEICAQAEAYSRTCSVLGASREEQVLILTPESRIVGRIRRRSDGSAIVGATVVASNRNGLRIPDRFTSSGDGGTFSIDALPAGGYEVIAVSEHCRSIEQWIAVGLGETSAPLTLWADSAVRVSGQIFISGAPCPSGTLLLSGAIGARGLVAQDGTVHLDGIPSGRYDATAQCDGAAPRTVSIDVQGEPVRQVFDLEKLTDPSHVSRAPSEDTTEVTIEEMSEPLAVSTEPANGVLSGRVTSEDGVPVADAWVTASRSDLITARVEAPPTLTDADGTFQIAAVSGAPYTLMVASPLGDAELHEATTGEEVRVRVLAPASLSGRVQTARGGPVPEFTVTYRSEDNQSGYGLQGGNSAFNVSMLEPGTYALQVISPLGSALERLRISPREAATVTLTLSDAQLRTPIKPISSGLTDRTEKERINHDHL